MYYFTGSSEAYNTAMEEEAEQCKLFFDAIYSSLPSKEESDIPQDSDSPYLGKSWHHIMSNKTLSHATRDTLHTTTKTSNKFWIL